MSDPIPIKQKENTGSYYGSWFAKKQKEDMFMLKMQRKLV